MEIKIQLKDRVISITFGYKTQWYESVYFITVAEEFFENREVVHANILYTFFKRSRCK